MHIMRCVCVLHTPMQLSSGDGRAAERGVYSRVHEDQGALSTVVGALFTLLLCVVREADFERA